MAAQQFLTLKQKNGQTGQISLDEIAKLTIPDFVAIEPRLTNVRRRKRHDTVVYLRNTALGTAHVKEIFRKGKGAQDTYANSNTEYTKTDWHTNMPRGGDFGEGTVTVVSSIEAYLFANALQPTWADGAPSNARGVTAITNYDPAMFANLICRGFKIEFWRGETMIVDGLFEDFPQQSGITGAAGAAVGAVFQNGGGVGSYLDNPQVFRDNEDFHVKVVPLHGVDLTSATGLDVQFAITVKLNTVELRPLYA